MCYQIQCAFQLQEHCSKSALLVLNKSVPQRSHSIGYFTANKCLSACHMHQIVHAYAWDKAEGSRPRQAEVPIHTDFQDPGLSLQGTILKSSFSYVQVNETRNL